MNVALTVVFVVITTMQVVPLLLVQPLQPAKVEPPDVVAVSVTVALLAKLPEQVEPQLMPPVSEVTVPVPVPALETVRVRLLDPLLPLSVGALQTAV